MSGARWVGADHQQEMPPPDLIPCAGLAPMFDVPDHDRIGPDLRLAVAAPLAVCARCTVWEWCEARVLGTGPRVDHYSGVVAGRAVHQGRVFARVRPDGTVEDVA